MKKGKSSIYSNIFMEIINKYQLLTQEIRELRLISKIQVLREQCIHEKNIEYYYLCNLLIIDIYIDYNLLDDALKILNKDIKSIDSVSFKYIYAFYIERIIFISIKNKDFNSAFEYASEKKHYINKHDKDEVNRWNLEIAYIYAELKEKSKALKCLKTILTNSPNNEILSHTLSNLTKLYIDLDRLDEAKKTLNECYAVSLDHDGITYCNYLLAQILVRENKHYDALNLYENIFNEEVNPEFLSLSIDYLELLINLKKFDKAQTLINRITPS